MKKQFQKAAALTMSAAMALQLAACGTAAASGTGLHLHRHGIHRSIFCRFCGDIRLRRGHPDHELVGR